MLAFRNILRTYLMNGPKSKILGPSYDPALYTLIYILFIYSYSNYSEIVRPDQISTVHTTLFIFYLAFINIPRPYLSVLLSSVMILYKPMVA